MWYAQDKGARNRNRKIIRAYALRRFPRRISFGKSRRGACRVPDFTVLPGRFFFVSGIYFGLSFEPELRHDPESVLAAVCPIHFLVEPVSSRAVPVQFGQQCGLEGVRPSTPQGVADVFPSPDVRQCVPLSVRVLVAHDVSFPELQHALAQVAERERGRFRVRGEHGGVRLQADAFVWRNLNVDFLRCCRALEADAGRVGNLLAEQCLPIGRVDGQVHDEGVFRGVASVEVEEKRIFPA